MQGNKQERASANRLAKLLRFQECTKGPTSSARWTSGLPLLVVTMVSTGAGIWLQTLQFSLPCWAMRTAVSVLARPTDFLSSFCSPWGRGPFLKKSLCRKRKKWTTCKHQKIKPAIKRSRYLKGVTNLLHLYFKSHELSYTGISHFIVFEFNTYTITLCQDIFFYFIKTQKATLSRIIILS